MELAETRQFLPLLIYTLYNVYINKGRNWRVSDPHFLDFDPPSPVTTYGV